MIVIAVPVSIRRGRQPDTFMTNDASLTNETVSYISTCLTIF